MRKDEEPEEALAAAAAEDAGEKPLPRAARKVVETDEDVEEDELLGEATLAKLSAARKPDESVDEEEEETEEKTEEKAEDLAKARERKAKEEAVKDTEGDQPAE